MKGDVRLRMDCDCGNEVIDFIYDPKDDLLFVSMMASMFYERQTSPLKIIFNRIKHAWFMLWGKEFHMFDLCMADGKEHVYEIEKWVATCKERIENETNP